MRTILDKPGELGHWRGIYHWLSDQGPTPRHSIRSFVQSWSTNLIIILLDTAERLFECMDDRTEVLYLLSI